MGADQIDREDRTMTLPQITIAAVASGTCWTILITRSIAHATDRVIKRIDEFAKTLDNIESKQR
jgi:hypothetical protein